MQLIVSFFVAQYWEMFVSWRNILTLKIIISMYFINDSYLNISTLFSSF
jgi:hypothetical protein